MLCSSLSRAALVSLPWACRAEVRILMFTSWAEVSTPAELSMASVSMRPPARAKAMRPAWVTPRLAPSPTTATRSSAASTRTASLALSPTSALASRSAFT